MIDCADQMVLAGRFARRITANSLAEMLWEAVLLSDNGPEYTSHRFRPFVRAMGLIPCHTPRRSSESNDLAKAFFGSFKRDHVYQACLDTVDAVARQLPGWIELYNQQAPHRTSAMQSPDECYAGWLVKNKIQPVQNQVGQNTFPQSSQSGYNVGSHRTIANSLAVFPNR